MANFLKPHNMIPEKVLESLFCTICYKYLTVTPIGINYFQGGNICGRCLYTGRGHPTHSLFEYFEDSNNSFQDINFPLTLFGYISRDSLVPCVNRFEGCHQLLPFSKIQLHEKNCKFEQFQCNNCSFKGVGSQLIQHFRIKHSKHLLLDTNSDFCLRLNGNFCRHFLYKSSLLFLMKVEYFKDMSQFVFETVCLGNASCTARINLKFKVPHLNEFVLVSDSLCIFEQNTFNLSVKLSNNHLNDADRIYCNYRIIFD